MPAPGAYRRLRLLHLLAGLLATPALLVYAISALQLTLPPLGPRTTETQADFKLDDPRDAMAVLGQLRQRGIEGALTHAAYGPGGELSITLVAGAARHEVSVGADGQARVATDRGGALARLRNLHFVSGRHRDAAGMGLWAQLSWLSGVALLVLAGTGLPMWLRRPAERRLGLALLLGNLLWAGVAVTALLAQ